MGSSSSNQFDDLHRCNVAHWIRVPLESGSTFLFWKTQMENLFKIHDISDRREYSVIFLAYHFWYSVTLQISHFWHTRSDGGYSVDRREYREYRLEGFSKYLRESVIGNGNWKRIMKCLEEKDVCNKLIDVYATPTSFFAAHLTPLQSGCCKPPSACGYGYVNPTIWVNNPLNNNPIPNADCNAWSNNPAQLCYGCDSCKAGLLGSIRLLWRKANAALIISAVVLISVYIIACSAFRNVQTEELFRRYKWGNP